MMHVSSNRRRLSTTVRCIGVFLLSATLVYWGLVVRVLSKPPEWLVPLVLVSWIIGALGIVAILLPVPRRAEDGSSGWIRGARLAVVACAWLCALIYAQHRCAVVLEWLRFPSQHPLEALISGFAIVVTLAGLWWTGIAVLGEMDVVIMVLLARLDRLRGRG